LATGAPYTIETRMVRTDGKVLEVLLHAEAIWDGDEVIGMWGVLQDVTNARAHADKLAAAEQAAQVAWEHALAERGTLTRFQQALLPTGLPEVPGATLAADYLAVADRIDVGGDWYDAFGLPDGRICLSIGDVMGHDLQAAATMGQIRAVTRGYAAHQPDPGSVLTQLNRLVFLAYPSDTLISAVVFLYEPTTGRLRWANAGHPHPLVAHPAPGGAEVVTLDRAEPILGVLDDAIYPTQQVTLAEYGTLLCYTDGLIEHRASDLPAAQKRLRALLADAIARPEPLPATKIVDRLRIATYFDGPPEDDVCTLVLQRRTGAR
jgi:sigma-B regulation protein RsbU (phosphoserine phosphatase)